MTKIKVINITFSEAQEGEIAELLTLQEVLLDPLGDPDMQKTYTSSNTISSCKGFVINNLSNKEEHLYIYVSSSMDTYEEIVEKEK